MLLATACLPYCATSAIAAPPPTVVDGWAGPYVGAYFAAAAGGGAVETVGQYTLQTNTNVTRLNSGGPGGQVTGSMVDLFAGRNWSGGNFVVGGQIEATISSNINLSNTGLYQSGVVGLPPGSTSISGTDPRLTFRAGLVGRAGFLAHPNLLLYGLVGLEFGHFTFPDDDDTFGSANRNFAVGYTAGAGLEARYDQNWSVRAEYRYSHFGTERMEYSAASNLLQRLNTVRNDHINMQVAKLGLVYRFGDNGPLTAMAAMPRSPQQVWADSWAGPYAGIYFGAGAGHAAESFSTSTSTTQVTTTVFPPGFPFPNIVTTRTDTATTSALLAGDVNGSMNELFLGYNWRSGRFIAGVQAEGTLFSDVGWKASGPSYTRSTTVFNGVNLITENTIDTTLDNQKLRSAVGLVARAGFLATPDVLLYGFGGVEFGNFVYARDRSAIGGDNGKWVTGYTAGAGGEVRITDHWSLRGEYRYMHFDVERDQSRPASSGSNNGSTIVTSDTTSLTSRNSSVDFHVGKIGVVYKFGGAGPASAMAAIPSSVAATWADGWTGPYFGAYFGAGNGDAQTDFTRDQLIINKNNVNAPPSITNFNGTLAGPMSGTQVDLFAGYSVRKDRFVFGGQIEATQFSDVSFKTSGAAIITSPGNPSYSYQQTDHNQRLRSMVSVVARAGFLATPNLLLYGLGGLAFGHFTYTDGIGATTEPDGKWVTGYTVGAGGELKVARHWSLRGEYRYLHFGVDSSANSFRSSASSDFSDSIAYRTAADFHVGKVGLVYRIGDDPASAMAAMPGATTACCDRWTGFSAGVYGAAGTGWVQDTVAQFTESTTFQPPFPLSGSTTSSSGTSVGNTQGGTVDLFAGYNWRSGRFVVGGQAEASVYADVGLKSRGILYATQTLARDGSTFSSSATSEFQQILRSRAALIARVGFLASENLLLYGLAGAEFGHFAFLEGKDTRGSDDNKWARGYTVGTGAELKLTDRWSLRAEYRYARFALDRRLSINDSSIDPVTPFTRVVTTDTNTHTVADFHIGKIGVAYNFCYCE